MSDRVRVIVSAFQPKAKATISPPSSPRLIPVAFNCISKAGRISDQPGYVGRSRRGPVHRRPSHNRHAPLLHGHTPWTTTLARLELSIVISTITVPFHLLPRSPTCISPLTSRGSSASRWAARVRAAAMLDRMRSSPDNASISNVPPARSIYAQRWARQERCPAHARPPTEATEPVKADLQRRLR